MLWPKVDFFNKKIYKIQEMYWGHFVKTHIYAPQIAY
jgi:hypothetical protein